MSPSPRNPADASLFLRVHFANGERFGPGKAELLAAIDRTGSISEAARSMNMSYRRAWLLVQATGRLFGRPVVLAAPGGRRGGGASLTPFGRELVECYRTLVQAVERASRSAVGRMAAWAQEQRA